MARVVRGEAARSVAEVVASRRPRRGETDELVLSREIIAVKATVTVFGGLTARVARGLELRRAQASFGRAAVRVTVARRKTNCRAKIGRRITREPEAVVVVFAMARPGGNRRVVLSASRTRLSLWRRARCLCRIHECSGAVIVRASYASAARALLSRCSSAPRPAAIAHWVVTPSSPRAPSARGQCEQCERRQPPQPGPHSISRVGLQLRPGLGPLGLAVGAAGALTNSSKTTGEVIPGRRGGAQIRVGQNASAASTTAMASDSSSAKSRFAVRCASREDVAVTACSVTAEPPLVVARLPSAVRAGIWRCLHAGR